MRRLAALAVCALAGLAVRPAAQEPPLPQGGAFRAEIDVIQLDVSVLDRDRRPVRGLTAADFTVFEDGKPQRLVAVTEIDAARPDALPSVRMAYVPPDVTSNDLADQLGGGRLLAIVIDDKNIPADSIDIAMSTRALARLIIDDLGPTDLAAVVFAREAGRTQDFTRDRSRLLSAIDSFTPRPLAYLPDSRGGRPIEGDAQRFSGALSRSRCARAEPAIAALDTVIARFATIPNLRKTLVFLSVGVPVSFASRNACDAELSDVMRRAFQVAQRANVNVHTVDPSGLDGYDRYMRELAMRGGRSGAAASGYRFVPGTPARHDFARIAADHTGGRAVVSTDVIEPALSQILEENDAYYLVGYQSANGNPDGKFRRIEVKVNQRDVTARTRSGYWARAGDALVNPREDRPPSSLDLSYAGMMSPANLPLRVTALPMRPAAAGPGRDVDVGVVLTARLPAVRLVTVDTLTITRNVYDELGRSGRPIRETMRGVLRPDAGDEAQEDVFVRLPLSPGRHQLRFNVHSALMGQSSTIYADVDVPDLARSAVALSAVALGPPDEIDPAHPLAGLLPMVPTTARTFSPGERIDAFVRVFEGGTGPLVPVTMSVQVLDGADAVLADETAVLTPEMFAVSRQADHRFVLPLDRLSAGPHLLSVSARLPGGRTARQDLVFTVR